jgi:hypothetical protein
MDIFLGRRRLLPDDIHSSGIKAIGVGFTRHRNYSSMAGYRPPIYVSATRLTFALTAARPMTAKSFP